MLVVAALAAGAVIGALARLLLPGRQDLSVSATILAGLLGAGTVGTAVGGATDTWLDLRLPSVIGSVLGAAVFVLAVEWVNRVRRAREEQPAAAALAAGGESARVEFKSSARRNLRTGEKDARMELAVARTVAGFANTRGGTLLVGVDDDGRASGLAEDYALVRGNDRDRYELWLHDLLERCLGRATLRHVTITFERLDGEDVCRVDVAPADAPVFLRPHSGERHAQLPVRVGNSTRDLAVDEAVEHVLRTWPQGRLVRAAVAWRRERAERRPG